MYLMLADVNESLQWAQFVIVPVLLGIIGLFGNGVLKTIKAVKETTQEAADSTRPNGTGHVSQTAMIEDVLLHLGETKGEIKNLLSALQEHTIADTTNFNKLESNIDNLKHLFENRSFSDPDTPQGD